MASDSQNTKKNPQLPGSQAPGETDEQGELFILQELSAEQSKMTPEARALARQISERITVRKPQLDLSAKRGAGELFSVPYRGSSDEIDLDKTITVLVEKPVLEDADILIHDRLRTKRTVVLLVDVSGSMKGERIKAAAATVGALAAELRDDSLGVIAFWSDAAVILEPGDPVNPELLLDKIMRIPARGLTNVAFPLEVAKKMLRLLPARESRVLLLSDCVHNAGPDPRPIAAQLPRLDVLLDASGEKDVELGRELAAKGRGICKVIRTHRDVAPALTQIFNKRN